ncbi:MAG: Fe-S protein assembly chaperone HscA [Rickettsiales bacterium]|nr:Fe-S protein assembly chaperone HscA [Rickettsiales bacterium]
MSLLQIHEPGQTPDPHAEDAVAIGIDLGTTHSVVSLSSDAQAEVLREADGVSVIPSIVSYGEGVKVGYLAKQDLIDGKPHVIASIKRLMGKGKADLPEGEPLPFTLANTDHLALQIGDAVKTPVEISADILKHIKAVAEAQLGRSVEKAVITVPAYFDDAARTATRDAARIAGLEVLRLINEPTAAALAYGLEHESEGIYAIYDLGGGTFDISILKLEKGVFQVLATAGDTQLGGDDIDHALATLILDKTQAKADSETSLNQLHMVARQAKEALSENETVELAFAGKAFTLTRAEMDKAAEGIIARSLGICEQALLDAQLDAKDIQGVVLVGGSTRMLAVQTSVKDFFDAEPLKDINPDEVVAVGAALQAEALTVGADHLLLDVTPLSLGLETMGGIVEKLIYRNSPIPVSAHQEFTTYQDGQTAMKIHVLQGEREMVDQCRSLAHFTLKGIPPLPANVARIKVSFVVDADGLLTVSAEETTTGIRQDVEVKPSYGLEIDDIEQMIRNSMENAKDDIMERLLTEARVEAQRVIYDFQSAFDKDGALLSDDEIQVLKAQQTKLEQAMMGDERELIDHQLEKFNSMLNPFAQRRMDKAIGSALQGSHVDEIEEKRG